MVRSFDLGQITVLSAVFVSLIGVATVSRQSSFDSASSRRRFTAIYRRLSGSTALTAQPSAGLRRAVAADIKAMNLNSRQAPRISARFNRSGSKRENYHLDIVAYKTREHPFVALHQVKVFVDGKEIFQSLGGGNLGAPGTGLFFCPIPPSSQPSMHDVRVVDTVSGAAVTLREMF